MHLHLVLFYLTLAFAFTNAKLFSPINDLSEDIIYTNEDFHRLARLEAILNYLENRRDHHRYELLEKRAKSIVKGDPREFMG